MNDFTIEEARDYINNKTPPKIIHKSKDELVIAGYASIKIVDSENELVTIEALKDAFPRFMKNPQYRNVMYYHSNAQVGEVLESYKDSNGKVWKSEVDNIGLFVVIKLRDDIEIAKRVSESIRSGQLDSYSIGGEALDIERVCTKDECHFEITKMDFFEITLCDDGMNNGAKFKVLKGAHEDAVKYLERYKSFTLFKNFVCLVGSTAEKGEGNDVDLLIRTSQDDPNVRHLRTRLFKQHSEKREDWDDVHIIVGDEVGPHDTHYPLYDLALVRAKPERIDLKTVEVNKMSRLDEIEKNISKLGTAVGDLADVVKGMQKAETCGEPEKKEMKEEEKKAEMKEEEKKAEEEEKKAKEEEGYPEPKKAEEEEKKAKEEEKEPYPEPKKAKEEEGQLEELLEILVDEVKSMGKDIGGLKKEMTLIKHGSKESKVSKADPRGTQETVQAEYNKPKKEDIAKIIKEILSDLGFVQTPRPAMNKSAMKPYLTKDDRIDPSKIANMDYSEIENLCDNVLQGGA